LSLPILPGRGRSTEIRPSGQAYEMTLSLRVRKLALSAHVLSSVGWVGAVTAFLALSLAGLTSQDPDLVRASYVAMELIGWSVIVPLSLSTLPTGLIMSLGTEWGLIRHYWVVAKLLITIVATGLLLIHMQPVGHLASVVTTTTLARGELAGMRIQLVADAAAAFVALVAATLLSLYKPRGLTPYGRGDSPVRFPTPEWPRIVGILSVALVILFLIIHLVGGGLGNH
jgi:hypothetical protein